LRLEIITPDKVLYKGEVTLVQVPGSKGSFAILKNHAPIVSTLEEGAVRIVDKHNKTSAVDIKGGMIEVHNNTIIVLADTA